MEFEHGFIDNNPAIVFKKDQQPISYIEMKYYLYCGSIYAYKCKYNKQSKKLLCLYDINIIDRLHEEYPHFTDYKSLRDLVRSHRYLTHEETRSELSDVLSKIVRGSFTHLGLVDDEPYEDISREMTVFAGRLVGCLEATHLGDVIPYRQISGDTGEYSIGNKVFVEKAVREGERFIRSISYYDRINFLLQI